MREQKYQYKEHKQTRKPVFTDLHGISAVQTSRPRNPRRPCQDVRATGLSPLASTTPALPATNVIAPQSGCPHACMPTSRREREGERDGTKRENRPDPAKGKTRRACQGANNCSPMRAAGTADVSTCVLRPGGHPRSARLRISGRRRPRAVTPTPPSKTYVYVPYGWFGRRTLGKL